jgi:hypothetical protein
MACKGGRSHTKRRRRGLICQLRARSGEDGEGLHTEILAGGHELVADEPTSPGGTNADPNPYD